MAIGKVGVGVAVLVWKDGKFLMGERVGSHGIGSFTVPGGHLEFGETIEECAIREVLEETTLTITNVRVLTITNDIFEADNKHYVTIWVESDWVKGEPTITEPNKWVNMTWRDFKSLPEPLWQPGWTNLRKAKPELFQ